MTTYLGMSAAHDSSVCFYKDGKIQFFMKEERVTRKKRDSDPVISLYNFDTNDDIVFCYSFPNLNYPSYTKNNHLVSKKYNVINSYDLSDSHHLVHANLAFYDSNFDTSLVFVVDRNGSTPNINGVFYDSCRESESVYIASYPNSFIPIYKNYWAYQNSSYEFIKEASLNNPNCEFNASSMYSITKVYETATALIKEGILENGKTMGLSAYGDKKLTSCPMFTKESIAFDYLFGHEQILEDQFAINLQLQKFAKKVGENDYHLYANYAWQVQKQTQEALANLVNKYVQKTGIKNVCITGGYGLNVVANHYLITQFPEINFFFEPLADDSGNSIGAAMKVYRDITLDNKKYPLGNTFFNGFKYDLNKIKGKSVNAKDVAKLLLNGKSVAVYQGVSESGPRALGNRSILFDARDKNAKNKVNKIKKREWYRPFAGMVLESDANIYFDMGKIKNSPYMTVSFPVKANVFNIIPGVIHVDNTCRIQTINESNTNIYDLIKEFKELSGVSVILNTSFNIAGEPLVETPDDAIKTLKNSELDYIWFPEISKIMSKKDLT